MRTFLSLSALLALGGALPACSALGLDNLPQSDCVRGADGVSGDAFCASLATLVPTGDACHTWQCNEQSHHCEQLARDDDGDGAPSMMCAAGATPDCDDDPATGADDTPGRAETCDGLDQNCDGVPDDGVVASSEMASGLTTIVADPDQVLLAYQRDADEAMLLTRNSTSYHAVTVTSTATPTDLVFSQPPGGTISLPQADGAIAPMGSGSYALAVRRVVTPMCQQFALFPLASAASAVTLRATDESLLPACPGGAQQITAPALAGDASGAVLVAWLAGTDDDRVCGAAPARTVSIGAARLDPRATARNRIGPTSVTLGESVGDGPPVVLALGDAFLVAYPKADGTIDVHLVTVDVSTGVPTITSSDVAYTEPAHAMTQGVTLALGPSTGTSTSVALAYHVGCGGMNPITVRLLTRNGSTVTGSSTPLETIGTGLARARLHVSYQPRASEWIVGWRSGLGLSVQRLFEDGAAEGEPFDVVSSTGIAAFVIEPLASGPLYRAILVDGVSLNQVTFGCAAPTP